MWVPLYFIGWMPVHRMGPCVAWVCSGDNGASGEVHRDAPAEKAGPEMLSATVEDDLDRPHALAIPGRSWLPC
jgi:hypothetical protein